MKSPIMQRFEYDHHTEPFLKITKQIHALAKKMNDELPDCPEKNAGLGKLLEAQHFFISSIIYGD